MLIFHILVVLEYSVLTASSIPLKSVLVGVRRRYISQVYSTVVPTKSDSDVIICLQLLSKTLT